jgi:transcriptional antiterminator RfaH
MKKWYLLYTKPRQEKLAFCNLQNQSYEVFLPLAKVEKINKGIRKIFEEPIFSRYLFIRLDQFGSQSWIPIRSTVGVSCLVKFGHQFAEVSDELVIYIQKNLDGIVFTEKFKSGDFIKVTQGPFKGIEAVFKIYDGNERAILLIELLSKKIEAKFDLEFLKKFS